jgi:hypothetical protein
MDYAWIPLKIVVLFIRELGRLAYIAHFKKKNSFLLRTSVI